MDLLVVGGGGREHAIIKKLKENPVVETIYALPGNGGIAADAVCVPEIGATEIGAIVDFAVSHAVGFAVVAPDDPLALGCVDALHAAGIPCFGPDARAARIESSKVFAKDLMKKYHIPTAQYEVFDTSAAALAYLKTASFPIVIKADGLALGKGVLISRSYEEAEDAVRTMMEDRAFGDSGSRVVIEEFLTGPEVSVLAFTDGTAIAPMVSSMDHKRAGDGDTGPNTGGMGTVAPNPCYTEDIARVCMDTISLPASAPGNVTIYHAGDRLDENGQLVTSGGRVLGVTATGPTLRQALHDAYAAARAVDFDGKYLRHDIGQRALAALAD